ncbi:MAG: hypothetical protein RLZZ342_154 [Candidatus Parcubacteria bacterium]|jgi:peptidoglycan hydrolase-like protein with peptidoglycan-binding domain
MTRYLLSFVFVCSILLAPHTIHAAQCTWDRDLSLGSRGEDVRALQVVLNADAETRIAVAGAGSPGSEGVVFGTKTRNAVIRFQEKYAADILVPAGLSKGTGSVRAFTRTKLLNLCTHQVDAPAQTSSALPPSLTVSAPPQPASTLALAGAWGLPFTTIALTAGPSDVEVHSITIERAGFAVDQVFAGAYIEDDAGEYSSDEKLFDSNHRITFANAFTVPSNTTKTLTVYGSITDDVSSYEGQMPMIRIVGIDSSVPAVGTLPMLGTGHTVNGTITIGGATAVRSAYDPGADQSKYINDTAVRFSGIRITANSEEDITLKSITWDQAGTASSADLANVVTVVDDNAYPAEVDGRWYTTTFPNGITIRKGYSADVHIRGDLLPSGAKRTVKFDIRESGDVELYGQTYGFGVNMWAAGNTSDTGNSVFITSDGTTDGDEGTPFYSGASIEILSGGFISIGR